MTSDTIAAFGVIVGAIGVLTAAVSVVYTIHRTTVADLRVEIRDVSDRLAVCEGIKDQLTQEKLDLLERLVKAGM